ncbi:MAG: hypothetical protein KatS3mg010_0582 [Acidimicrobiia bacterium]|nr:MAG: hypothetical protein KatS3mg010_0582 [Acidimicrobiia bacterium]
MSTVSGAGTAGAASPLRPVGGGGAVAPRAFSSVMSWASWARRDVRSWMTLRRSSSADSTVTSRRAARYAATHASATLRATSRSSAATVITNEYPSFVSSAENWSPKACSMVTPASSTAALRTGSESAMRSSPTSSSLGTSPNSGTSRGFSSRACRMASREGTSSVTTLLYRTTPDCSGWRMTYTAATQIATTRQAATSHQKRRIAAAMSVNSTGQPPGAVLTYETAALAVGNARNASSWLRAVFPAGCVEHGA